MSKLQKRSILSNKSLGAPKPLKSAFLSLLNAF